MLYLFVVLVLNCIAIIVEADKIDYIETGKLNMVTLIFVFISP